MRIRMLAGNWKMNKLNADLADYFAAFARAVRQGKDASIADAVDMLFAVPAPLLARAAQLAEPLGIRIAAQNIHWEASGAYTGEISLAMIKEVGVTATLIGHSERRQYFAETDETVLRKTQAALAADVMPIVCIGETLAERDSGKTASVVTRQLRTILAPIADPKDMVIAYEPVWAIGTGRTATPAQAQEVHRLIRGLISESYGVALADTMRILYGGSANPANIAELLLQPDIDGGLVGGASLKPADFASMVLAGAAV